MKRSSRNAESAFAEIAGDNPFDLKEILAREQKKEQKKAKKKGAKK